MATVATKERPFRAYEHEVRAILDGRQTQTRRVVKPQPSGMYRADYSIYSNPEPYFEIGGKEFHCPYGQAGDRLWVRERHWYRVTDGIVTYTDGSLRTHPSAIIGSMYVHSDDVSDWPKNAKQFGFKCVPSIHMPRWASRITLEITGVRVERLKDISELDALAEGVKFGTVEPRECRTCARGAFMDLWESINGKDSWALNPWVWAIEFRRVN